jgi:hypothetical protein
VVESTRAPAFADAPISPQIEIAKLPGTSRRAGVVARIVFAIAFLFILTIGADWLNGVICRRLRRLGLSIGR